MTVIAPPALKTRLAAALRAKRVSPFMAAALATLAALAGASGLWAASAFSSLDSAGQSVKLEWRPPNLSAFEPLAAKPPAADAQTLSRPLFAKTRRVEAAKTVAAPADNAAEPPAPPPALSLAGIVHFGSKSRAYLSGSGDGEWYGVGEKVAGWTVAEIRRIDLTLTSGGQSTELKLYPEPEPAAAAAPPASPTPRPKFRDRG